MTRGAEVYSDKTIRPGQPGFREMCADAARMCGDDVYGPFCTLERGHDGDHMAHAYASIIVARWSQREAA
jgi:hypothetical protein